MYDHIAENAKYEARKKERELLASNLRASHPYLVPGTGYVTAAKNIRIELRRAFPSITFRVNSKSYSGGNSIRVTWVDGPTTEQVESINNKYSGGSFDGMTDSYTYSYDAWIDAFGDAKYIFANRDYSDRVLDSVIGRIARDYGATIVGKSHAELWRNGQLWQLRSPSGSDVSTAITRALSKHTCCVHKEYRP